MQVVAPYKKGMTLAEAIRTRMGDLGIVTQREAADRLGCDQASMSRWLRGEPPRDESVVKLAHFLGVTPARVVDFVTATKQRSYSRNPWGPQVEELEEDLSTAERLTALEARFDRLEAMIRSLQKKRAAQ